jgi:predicted Zn-dependent peptidase
MSATASSIDTLSPEGRAVRSTTRNIRRSVLSNGMVVLTERMNHVNSLSMGVWLGNGSRDETADRNGISHFVEHMVFKGTTSRSAQQIAREVDSMGGNLDAFTSKENICFNIKVLEEKADPALDVLSDLVLHPTFTAEDVAREQGVILEEIKMDEDNPDYLVNEIFSQKFWKGDALGRPILGTAETVSSFDREILFHEHGRRFAPQTMVFSAAGDLEHDSFVARVEHSFGSLRPHPDPLIAAHTPPSARPHITLKRKRSLEQVQICLGVPAPPVNDPRRYAVYLMNTILGGGMSSRLFQTIREDRGLAYSIYSEMSPFRDTGSLCVYAGASVEKAREVVQLTVTELGRLITEAVPQPELTRAKDQLRSNIVMGLESSGSRMANLARQQMYYGRFFGVDEIIADIDRVTAEEIQTLAQELFQPEKLALSMLGNLGTMKIDRADLVA